MLYFLDGVGRYMTSEWERARMVNNAEVARQELERFRGTMGRRCVAAGCCNAHSDSTSMHKFPKDWAQEEIREAKSRERWSATENSFLCSEHFEAVFWSRPDASWTNGPEEEIEAWCCPNNFCEACDTQQTTESSSSCEAPTLTTAHKRAPASSSTIGTGDPPKKRMAFEKRET